MIDNSHRSREDNTLRVWKTKPPKAKHIVYKICERKGDILTRSKKGYKTLDGDLDS